jgi:hypothetical protein
MKLVFHIYAGEEYLEYKEEKRRRKETKELVMTRVLNFGIITSAFRCVQQPYYDFHCFGHISGMWNVCQRSRETRPRN